MYILASTFGGIIHVNTRISCIHVQCLPYGTLKLEMYYGIIITTKF